MSEPRARLNGGTGRYRLSFAMRFRVVPYSSIDDRWDVQTFAYSYHLYLDDREFVAYHWDDEGVSTGGVASPHAHFGKELWHSGMRQEDRSTVGEISAAHMPTGLVPLTGILSMMMRDFGIEPFRWQGESISDAISATARSFAAADSRLLASFDWMRTEDFEQTR